MPARNAAKGINSNAACDLSNVACGLADEVSDGTHEPCDQSDESASSELPIGGRQVESPHGAVDAGDRGDGLDTGDAGGGADAGDARGGVDAGDSGSGSDRGKGDGTLGRILRVPRRRCG